MLIRGPLTVNMQKKKQITILLRMREGALNSADACTTWEGWQDTISLQFVYCFMLVCKKSRFTAPSCLFTYFLPDLWERLVLIKIKIFLHSSRGRIPAHLQNSRQEGFIYLFFGEKKKISAGWIWAGSKGEGWDKTWELIWWRRKTGKLRGKRF